MESLPVLDERTQNTEETAENELWMLFRYQRICDGSYNVDCGIQTQTTTRAHDSMLTWVTIVKQWGKRCDASVGEEQVSMRASACVHQQMLTNMNVQLFQHTSTDEQYKLVLNNNNTYDMSVYALLEERSTSYIRTDTKITDKNVDRNSET